VPLDLLEFLRLLGVTMCDAEDGSHEIQRRLEMAARANGQNDMRFFVLPTGVFVRVPDADGTVLTDFAPTSGQVLRLDQTAAVYQIAEEAGRGEIEPATGTKRLKEVLAAAPSRGLWQQVTGAGFLSLGLGLVLNPVREALVWYLGLGILVGLGQLAVVRYPRLTYPAPLLAAFVVSLIAVQFAAPFTGDDPLRLLVPTLVMLLPGAALTMAMVEFATKESVAGMARLGQGIAQLALLAFGVAAALSIVTEPESDATASSLGEWAPWCGAIVFALAASWTYVAPRGSAKWFVVVVLAVTFGQQLGQLFVSSELSGFIGGLVLAPVAFWLSGRANGLPSMVLFQPGFLVLVPGGLALTGAAELASGGVGSATDVAAAIVSVLAIALGVFVSSAVMQRPATSIAASGAARP
jgi:uncharacterized membrane protein YjjP (DUF1212 family)